MSDSDNEKHEGLAVSRKRTSVELDAMRRLHELSTLSVTEGDIEAILCEIVDTAIALTGADFGNIYLIDPGSSVFRLAAQRGFPQWWVDFWKNAPLGQGSCGVALQRRERVIVENVEQSSMFAGAALEMQLKAGVRAVQSTPLLSRSGKPLGVFSTQYRTPQRPDEDKLRLLDLLARQSADIIEHIQSIGMLRRQAALLRLSFDAIFVWRVEGGIESWSRGAETLYGFAEHEAIGKRPQDLLKTVFPVSRSEIERILKDRGNWEGELRHRTKDGREIIVSARLQLIPGENGTGSILEINRDITERKRMEEERAAELRRKDEFLRMLGHELRNPLAAISTAVQLLSGSASDDERASLNGMMDRQVKLMQRLLDDLIDLGRITHGHIQLKKGPINLARFLHHVTKVTQSITAQRGQEMILRLPSEVVTFKADEARLEQIATNLLNNASKYTPRGGRIEFSGAREGSEVVLRCKDSGRGIPSEMHQTIFQPFTRVEPFSDSRGEASLGIGLALVKQLVELHGGTISVESGGSGMGSEFVVRLPLEFAPSDQSAVPEAKPALGLSRSIVLIEDNFDVAGTMVIALEKAGYRVTLFADAFSTLAGISDLEPHAILLDIGLPGMDGYELAARLRKEQHLRHTLLIGLSGFKRREAAESANNFDQFFNKPVDFPALLTFLDTSTLEKVEALRALLIEDHADLAAATAELLRNEGFEVRIALSGREGLKAALEFKPQLTLCDLRLPDVQGQEVIRLLRSNPDTRHTYAVVLTAMSDGEIRYLNREAKRMDIDEFIPKPLTTEAVRRLVTKFRRQ